HSQDLHSFPTRRSSDLLTSTKSQCYSRRSIYGFLTTERKGSSMITEGKYTLIEKRGAVAKITINRPDKRNALSRDAIREMLSGLDRKSTRLNSSHLVIS